MFKSYAARTAHYNKAVRGVIIMTSEERREARYQRRKAKRELRRKELNALYGDFNKAISFEELVKAFYECRKGVNWKLSVQKYGAKLYENILHTRANLSAGKYKQRPFVEFDINERGKMRHIRSVYISDRVIQKSLCKNCLVPMLSNSFIYDNGASIKNKGTLFAIERLTEQLRRHYRKYGREGYIILGDFKSFFDSLNHQLIYENIYKSFDDKRILELLKRMIEPFGNIGLGLGSQVCQILAVGYPNKLDHTITCKYGLAYGRYMDDFYIICRTKEEAKYILDIVKNICNELKLTLSSSKTLIVKLTHGFIFLKTKFNITSKGKILKRLTRTNIVRMRRKLKRFKNLLDKGILTLDNIKVSYISWKGYALKKNSYTTVKNMDNLFKELFAVSI